ncbi:MAG TPA: hypothetical protein VN754_09055 [Candidatus Binataceae bacterium]|nr:hypothetical protein [Candidatus Binataceae bacterium]
MNQDTTELQTSPANREPVIVERPEAILRYKHHRRLVSEICQMLGQIARERAVALERVDIRPAWSHEYEETRGIVVDIEVRSPTEEALAYWPLLSATLEQRALTFDAASRKFLEENVSIMVRPA